MGETTEISWTDHTFNPWIGCTRVSPACDHCYAESLARRYGWAKWGPGEARKVTSHAYWRKPIAWNNASETAGKRARVFCASLADWADIEVDDSWRGELFDLIEATPNLEWLLLSKRHALVRGFLNKHATPRAIRNIRIGMTVENNDMAKLRLSRLRMIAEDGWPTFVSYEPALGAVDWSRWLDPVDGCVDWLIAGAESGSGARPAHPDWFRSARDTCLRFDVPFHFKQWGEWAPAPEIIDASGRSFHRFEEGTWVQRVGTKAAGAMLDGREWREFPT